MSATRTAIKVADATAAIFAAIASFDPDPSSKVAISLVATGLGQAARLLERHEAGEVADVQAELKAIVARLSAGHETEETGQVDAAVEAAMRAPGPVVGMAEELS